uniref:Uncharacterized protein n=1 Tax=Moniliophthora roreri TaxID=221103 RepID=A0A0W0FV55_MONRR
MLDSTSTSTGTDERGKSKPKKSRWSNTTMEVSIITLRVLKDTAEASPIPGLGAIPSLALEILTAIQSSWTAGSTGSIEKARGRRLNDPFLALILNRTMKEIVDFTKRQSGRNTFQRIVNSRADATIIQDYRKQFQHAISLFGVQSQIDVRAGLN